MIQKHQFKSSENLRYLAEKITEESSSTKPYLIITRVVEEEQFSAFEEGTGLTKSLLIGAGIEASHPYWYFYSNSPRFPKLPRIAGLDWDAGKGAVLQLDAVGERLLTSGDLAAAKHPVGNFVSELDIGLIVTEGAIDLSKVGTFQTKATTPPLILNVGEQSKSDPSAKRDRRLRDWREHRAWERFKPSGSQLNKRERDLLSVLTHDEPADVTVLNLMPTTPLEAQAWEFEPYKADLYVANGQRIERDLENYGYKSPSFTGKKELVEIIRQTRDGQATLILIGEAGPGNEGVRLPGSTEVLTARDFDDLADEGEIIALVCNSQSILSSGTGLSVTGVLMSNESRNILRVLLDRRSGPTVIEYLDIPIGERHLTKALVEVVAALLDANQTPALTTLQISTKRTKSAHRDSLNVPGTSELSGSSHDSDSRTESRVTEIPGSGSRVATPAVYWIALAGFLGGLGREIIRWQRLIERNRDDLYKKPRFLILSILLLGVGAGVAVIFVQLVTLSTFAYPVAFICGAGVEEIVRQAARLEIWTPPVPQSDPEFDDSASFWEFMTI
jgi:hypothetical protein